MNKRFITLAIVVAVVALGIGTYFLGTRETNFGIATYTTSQGGTGTSTIPTADQMLIGGDNSRYDVKTLTAGSGIGIATSSSAITISSTGGHDPLTLAGTPNYLTLTDQVLTLTKLDITDDTNLTVGAIGIELATNDIALTAGYEIPLTASTTNWNAFYDTPSSVITAGTGLSWSTNTLNAEVQTSDLHAAVTVSGTPDYITLTGQDIVRGTVDIGDDTNLAGTANQITLTDDTLSLAAPLTLPTGTTTATNLYVTGDLQVDGVFFAPIALTAAGDLDMGTNTIYNFDWLSGDGGAEGLSVSAAGLVGIGTSTPATLLDVFSTATTTVTWDSNSATQGACIKVKDMDGGGYTYITTLNGTLQADTVSCE